MKKINYSLKKIKECFCFIKIDFSFIIMLLLAFYFKEIKLFLFYFIFILFHELSHYFVAKKLGYMANSIKLSFFGATLEGLDDFLLEDELKVIFAGLLFNLIIVIFSYFCLNIFINIKCIFELILSINLCIFLFNILPIYPLDFGRIILAILTKRYLRKKAINITKLISNITILLFFIFSLFLAIYKINYILIFVTINLIILTISSSKNTSYKRELFIFHKAKLIKKGLIERNIYLLENVPKYKYFRYIDDYHFINFLILNNNYEIINKITEIEFYKEVGFM